MIKNRLFKVTSQTRPTVKRVSDPTIEDSYEPECEIELEESDNSRFSLRDSFVAKIQGEKALRVYKAGSLVMADIWFRTYKKDGKLHQRATVMDMRPAVNENSINSKFPWEDYD